METIRVDVRDSVAVVTLDDESRRNAISLTMSNELEVAFAELEDNEAVKAVVVTGAGPAFCAGGDLATLQRGMRAEYNRIYAAFLAVARSSLPTIAAVNGPATGAGLNLVLACDVRIASRSARFIPRFLNLGIHPGGGCTRMLQDAVGHQVATAMLLLGLELDGEDAVHRGLVLECVEDSELLERAVGLAAGARGPRPVIQRTKRSLLETPQLDRQQAVAYEADAQMWSIREGYTNIRRIPSAAQSQPSEPVA